MKGTLNFLQKKYGHLDEIIKTADDIMYEEKRILKQEVSESRIM